MKISIINAWFASGLFLLLGSILILVVYRHERAEALNTAEVKANIIIDHYQSVHAFLTDTFSRSGPDSLEFSTNRENLESISPLSFIEMRDLFREFHSKEYYCKESAINARNPAHEADSLEADFIKNLNSDSKLEKISGIRRIKGIHNFFVLKRGLVVKERCIVCHGDPSDAPPELVKAYGSEKGFHRNIGEVMSAISVRVPLSSGYTHAFRESLKHSGILLFLFSLMLFLILWLNNRVVGAPLAKLRDRAKQISTSQKYLGHRVPEPYANELRELALVFNEMSEKLAGTIATLEDRVRERTSKLTEANKNLSSEIEQRKKVQEEREFLIKDLTEALSQVKTLSGLLPICASCKKIRDDSGYWNQIEAYIKEHSDAEFSHSLCPNCARDLYPEVFEEKDKR